MSKRRALDQCRREADDSRARPAMVDEPLDNSAFTVWPSIGRQLPPRSVIFDMLCFYATATVRSDLMQPLAFDESAWLADQHPCEGREYYDRKRAEGKSAKEAIRALKRQISNVVYRSLVADARRLDG